jgi:predicted  nucleic acid-binding Zn-ribbon protein
MPADPNIASWLAGGAIAGAFGVLWWIAKRWINLQEEQFDELHEKVSKIDDKKLDIAQFNGWTRRVDEHFGRILAQQERAFAESREERQRQSEKIEELVSCTQRFNMNMVERVARLERDN